MTEKDKQLIAKAEHTIWENMSELADQCDTAEARNRIRALMKDRYHREND